MEPLKPTVILYHGHCPDGFASAYVAWKKFGDTASYVPVHHDLPAPSGLEHRDIYIIDFSYPKEVLLDIERKATSLVVLDHHKTAEDNVKAVKIHRFAKDQSGCGLAWDYLFPNTQTPKLISYVQEGDLNKSGLPHTHEILKVIYASPFTFEAFAKLESDLEDTALFQKYIEIGTYYSNYFKRTAEILAEDAELVTFEGHDVYAVNVPRIFKHEVAQLLWRKHGHPFAIVWYETVDGMKSVSMRSDNIFDVSDVAKKYGGGGHLGAAAFRVKASDPLPFKTK